MSENIRRIREGEYPFDGHPLLGKEANLAEGLAKEEFERAKSQSMSLATELRAQHGFETPFHNTRDLQDGHKVFQALMRLEDELKRTERGREKPLEELAKRTVAEAYGLSEDEARSLFKRSELMGEPGAPSEMPAKPRLTEGEMMPWLREWIDKRVTHNAFIQGASINHMTKALALARREIDAMDPALYQKYQLHANLAQLIQFLAPAPHPDSPPVLIAGEKRLRWENGAPRVEAKGIVFPVLVQELSKGVMETIMAHGLPKKSDLSEQELDAFQHLADHPANEAWHFMTGPAFASKLHKMFDENNVWMRYGEKPSAVRDSLYTYTLLSMLPATKLHSALRSMLRPGGEAQKEGARALRKELEKVEEDYVGGK